MADEPLWLTIKQLRRVENSGCHPAVVLRLQERVKMEATRVVETLTKTLGNQTPPEETAKLTVVERALQQYSEELGSTPCCL